MHASWSEGWGELLSKGAPEFGGSYLLEVEVREEVVRCPVEWRTEHKVGVRVSPRIPEEEFERVTDGKGGAAFKIEDKV